MITGANYYVITALAPLLTLITVSLSGVYRKVTHSLSPMYKSSEQSGIWEMRTGDVTGTDLTLSWPRKLALSERLTTKARRRKMKGANKRRAVDRLPLHASSTAAQQNMHQKGKHVRMDFLVRTSLHTNLAMLSAGPCLSSRV